MNTGPLTIDPDDAAVINTFAEQIGTTGSQLTVMAVKAIADHLRLHGSLTLPLRIGLPAPHCAHCPLARLPDSAVHTAPQNVIQGRW